MRSAASGYLRLAVRIGLGLVTFRLLYQSLSPEEFGFWTLLWAGFGYGILLDFGFGYAAQKRVAELSVHQDWAHLSEVLSTILCVYLLSAAAAALLGLVFAGPLVDLFNVSPANRETFRIVLQIFVIGIGLAFPLGLFPEILLGQQRMSTAYNIATLSIAANFIAVVLSVWLHLSFITLVILGLLCVLIPWAIAAWVALRHMPRVRLSPALFSRRVMIETTRFSVYAYLSALGNLVRNKADPPILSSLLGIAAVSPYQAGAKIGDMFGMLTRQVADVLSPTAAHLHARGDSEGLRQMLIDGLRFSVLAATPLYLVIAASMDGLLQLITGDAAPSPTMYWTGQLLLLWNYSLTLTHWVFKRMFFMAGQERRMMWQGVAEALANVILSIALTWGLRSILGVALGSVIPTIAFGWGILWGWAAKEAGVSRWQLLRIIVLPAWKGCLPLITTAAVLRLQPWWLSQASTPVVLAEAGTLAIVGLLGIWKLSLSPAERKDLAARLASRHFIPGLTDPDPATPDSDGAGRAHQDSTNTIPTPVQIAESATLKAGKPSVSPSRRTRWK